MTEGGIWNLSIKLKTSEATLSKLIGWMKIFLWSNYHFFFTMYPCNKFGEKNNKRCKSRNSFFFKSFSENKI